MPKCQNCGADVSVTAKFCSECGQDQLVSVPQDQRQPTEDVAMPPPPQPEDVALSPPPQPEDVQEVPSPPPQQGRSTVWTGVKLGLGACVVLPALVIIGLVFLVALFGREDDTTNSSPPANQGQAESKKQEEKKAEPVEEPDPINLSGSGQMATSPFQLESGLDVFSMSYQGDSNFIVNLLDENGSNAGRGALVNTIGSFQGSKAIQTRAGEHLLDVQEADLGGSQ
jgi:zinc-ribbon domain